MAQTISEGMTSDEEVGAHVAQFTVGVFQDVAWAEKGIEALKRQGFPSESLSLLAKADPAASALVERALGKAPGRLEVKGLGSIVASGTLVAALQGPRGELTRTGLAVSMRRVGFQPHDGVIFERLTERGGVLVAVQSEPRAADALAVLHCYGGGNAAIGAWVGRV